MSYVVIDLSNEEMLIAGKLGWYRQYEQRDTANIQDYDENRFNLTGLQAHRLGVMCEIAVAKHLGLDILKLTTNEWPSFYIREMAIEGPDLLGKYEVRRANTCTAKLPIRRKDVEYEAIIIQVYVDYIETDSGIRVPAQAELLGWADAAAEWPTAKVPSWSDGDSRVCKAQPMEMMVKPCLVGS